jgi:transposase
MTDYSKEIPARTMGIDLGDVYSRYQLIDQQGKEIESGRIKTTPAEMKAKFESMYESRIVIEAGTHSPWVSRLAEGFGHEVLVANPRKVQLISKNKKKSDEVDAQLLARLGRVDPGLLYPMKHRGRDAQEGLFLLKSRNALVKARTELITHLRGAVKSLGWRLPMCSAESFHRQVRQAANAEMKGLVEPLLEMIEKLSQQIKTYDEKVEQLSAEEYPETAQLQQVKGVGPLTSLAYVLVIEDPQRFRNARGVGKYVGLCPAQDDSGESQPQLRISKEGDKLLRRLLVSSAQYILGVHGEESDLRNWGLRLAARGGKNAKKRAVVAVARKLTVLLYALWTKGEVYQPLRQSQAA